MGDVAQILSGIAIAGRNNVVKKGTTSTATAAATATATATTNNNNNNKKDVSKALKLTGMSREMLNLVSGSLNTSSSGSSNNPSGKNKIATTTFSTARSTALEKTSTCLPPVAPSINNMNIGANTNKKKLGKGSLLGTSRNSPARKWVWAPFTSSARSDGLLLYHFVRAGVEYPDYPYARFDIHMDGLVYSNEEYEKHLAHSAWSKSETDQLVEQVKRFELRWPVIHDRWIGTDDNAGTGNSNTRSLEELQHRYYSIASILTQQRVDEVTDELQSQHQQSQSGNSILGSSSGNKTVTAATAAEGIVVSNLGTGSTNTEVFNLQKEVERKKYLTAQWKRTREEEEEETLLRQQLKLVEMQIRKLKKAGLHNLPAAAAGSNKSSTTPATTHQPQHASATTNATSALAPAPPSSDAVTASILSSLDPYFASAGPVPTPGIPYLQSHRLITPATGGSMGLNKTLISKMDTMLKELNVSSLKNNPTKRICDIYDSVRKNSLTMLMLQKVVKKKEADLTTKKNKLAKLTQFKQTVVPTATITTTIKPTSHGHGPNTITTISSQKLPIQQQQSSSLTSFDTTSHTPHLQPQQLPKTTALPTTTTTTKKSTSRKRPKKSEDGQTKPRKRKIKQQTATTTPAITTTTTIPKTSTATNNIVISSTQKQPSNSLQQAATMVVIQPKQKQPIAVQNNITTTNVNTAQGLPIGNNIVSLQQKQSNNTKSSSVLKNDSNIK